MKLTRHYLPVLILLIVTTLQSYTQPGNIEVLIEFSLDSEIGSLRAVPVQLEPGREALLFIWSKDKDIDPWIEMFYPPTDHLKFALYTTEGELIWKKILPPGTLNGIWFTPVFPFDLDKDGTDEIYFVRNTDSIHVLSYDHLRLEALNANTGETSGQWPWKRSNHEILSHTFRNFIFGGYAQGEPVLITGQGTYADMGIQAWNEGMESRWEIEIKSDEPGARGSHMCPIIDINKDGTDEIFWGERCIDIDKGKYLFIADKDEYNGHSDVIQPTLDRNNDNWYIFTCRESGDKGEIKPRVVMFDDKGERIWHDLETGHMDMGWTAHVNEPYRVLAFTISRGGKIAGPDGFFRTNVVEYAYEAFTGKKVELPFDAYNTVPVDLTGDGYHEFACALGEQADQNIYNIDGDVLGYLGEKAYIAMATKILDKPGEQILCYYPDGTIKIWGDTGAVDNITAIKRYQHQYYIMNRKLTGTGYNLVNLGGI
jgi:hypothetical protein